MNNTRSLIYLLASGLGVVSLVGGCATNSGVLPVGPDTYKISTGADNFRGGLSGAKRSAHSQASDFCATMGKEILVLRSTSSNNQIGKPVADYDLTFRCLASSDPELTRPEVVTEPDIVIESR